MEDCFLADMEQKGNIPLIEVEGEASSLKVLAKGLRVFGNSIRLQALKSDGYPRQDGNRCLSLRLFR